MALKTTATTDFNLDLNNLVEEAFERCGAELRSGYDMRTARRSLNLLTIEWANRGTNLWTIEQGEQVLTYNVADYDIPVDTIDLLDHVIRTGTGTNQTDINISRISMPTYAMIPNKNATGRPIQVWFQRKTGATNASSVVQYPQIHIWPMPDSAQTYTFVYWRLRRMQDAGDGVNGQDIPFRFLPCMVAGLAYYLSMKLPGVDPQRRMELKMDYEQQYQLAAEEDRETAPLRFVPRQMFVG
tara:strand:- start:1722 stop:2444 length:723 start_codon:yes stop_codon:yes gene_type:complete